MGDNQDNDIVMITRLCESYWSDTMNCNLSLNSRGVEVSKTPRSRDPLYIQTCVLIDFVGFLQSASLSVKA